MSGMIIAENNLSPADLKNVAKAVLKAQGIKEESWDDNRKRYNKNDREAANEVVKEFGLDDYWIYIIWKWNYENWNDVQSWANSILKSIEDK